MEKTVARYFKKIWKRESQNLLLKETFTIGNENNIYKNISLFMPEHIFSIFEHK